MMIDHNQNTTFTWQRLPIGIVETLNAGDISATFQPTARNFFGLQTNDIYGLLLYTTTYLAAPYSDMWVYTSHVIPDISEKIQGK